MRAVAGPNRRTVEDGGLCCGPLRDLHRVVDVGADREVVAVHLDRTHRHQDGVVGLEVFLDVWRGQIGQESGMQLGHAYCLSAPWPEVSDLNLLEVVAVWSARLE